MSIDTNTGNFGGLFDDNITEAVVQKKVVSYARSLGFGAEKFSSPAKRSVPDYLFTAGIFHFFIEFKAPGKEATEAQAKDHNKRRDRGELVFVCDDIEEGKLLVRKMRRYYSDNFKHYTEI